MDPISLSIGIIGLYSACRECFTFFADLNSAEENVRRVVRALRIQHSMLISWGKYWDIKRHDPALADAAQRHAQLLPENKKIGQYLAQNPYKIEGVETALCAIVDALSNYETLARNYGIELKFEHDKKPQATKEFFHSSPKHRDQATALKRKADAIKQNCILFRKRCKFVVTDSHRINDLICELESYNNCLRVLCPDGAYEVLKLNSLVVCLVQDYNAADVFETEKVAAKMKDLGNVSSSDLYSDLAKLAILREATDQVSKPLTVDEKKILLNLRYEDFTLRQTDKRSSMATWKRESTANPEAVWIEFKPYLDIKGVMVEDDVLKLGHVLMNKKTPANLGSCDCYGLYKDESNARMGLVYKLPGSLGTLSEDPDVASIDVRRPYSLLEAFSDYKGASPLGWRFRLAKALLKRLLIIHASGWVHKNIRSASIMFFPVNSGSIDRTRIATGEPYLMGWIYSRSNSLVIYPQNDDLPKGGPFDGMPFTRLGSRMDVHQHPDKQESPMIGYQSAYDIYSLGLVMLEIGLWQPLTSLVKPFEDKLAMKHAWDRHNFILQEIQPRLAHACGSIFAKVVKACLTIKSAKSADEERAQRELCLSIAAELEKCNA